MGGTELTTHPCLALRNDRKAEPCHKDAFVQQHVTHLYRGRRLPDDYRDDWRLARQWLEPRLGDRSPEVTCVVMKLPDQLGITLELANRAKRTGRNRWRERVREQLRSRSLGEHIT